eukprot:5884684-Ditylum_brightwellii.AAC.1
MGLPILGVLDGEEENAEDKDKKQEATDAKEPMGPMHVVVRLPEINSMLPYFPQPLNSKLPEDGLIEIIL